MALRLLTATLFLTTTLAQTPNIIPTDLTTGFNDKEVQVSFTSNAANGFLSGTTFSPSAVANEPTFALGDSNGISPSTLYTLLMIDVTCPSARKLHYARSNFQFAFAGSTGIETESAPLLEYKAPGAFGEKGDERRYVFLMYTNPQRRRIESMRLPGEGEVVDVKKLQGDNGLGDPVAGLGMVVRLGGTANCDSGASGPGSGGVSAAPSSTGLAGVSTAGTSSTTRASSAGVSTTLSTPSASGSVPLSSSGSGDLLSLVPSASDTEQPATSTELVETPLSTDDATAPSLTPPAGTSATLTSSAVGEQTANAAPEMMIRPGTVAVGLCVIAGIFVW